MPPRVRGLKPLVADANTPAVTGEKEPAVASSDELSSASATPRSALPGKENVVRWLAAPASLTFQF
jgi:hypothetical protein